MFDLEETAKRIGHYAWIELRLFEALGGWVAAVPELDVKLHLGTRCYNHAWHAELWHKRLPALREISADRLTKPANDAIAELMAALTEPGAPERTIEKLVGVYRVLVPHKIAAYTFHLASSSAVADGPTIRVLKLVIADELEEWRDGEMLIQSLLERDDQVERAANHQARLERLLVRAGGIAGPGSTATEAARSGRGAPG